MTPQQRPAPEPTETPTRLSHADERTLSDVAGQLAGAIYAVGDDHPLLRAMLAEALDGVDQVRGRDTRAILARARATGSGDR